MQYDAIAAQILARVGQGQSKLMLFEGKFGNRFVPFLLLKRPLMSVALGFHLFVEK